MKSILCHQGGITHSSYYPRFSAIPKAHQPIILRRLGFGGGSMRGWAKQYDPPCAVTRFWPNGIPIAWALLKRSRSGKTHTMAVFVPRHLRRQGIATRLAQGLVKFTLGCAPADAPIKLYPINGAGVALAKKLGVASILCPCFRPKRKRRSLANSKSKKRKVVK